jgi:hypothetical protein
MKEIILASEFLNRMELPYLFVMDNDELRTSHTWMLPDEYIQTLKSMLPWDHIKWFDNTGFLNWCKEKNYSFINTHPGTEAHQRAAEYILSSGLPTS